MPRRVLRDVSCPCGWSLIGLSSRMLLVGSWRSSRPPEAERGGKDPAAMGRASRDQRRSIPWGLNDAPAEIRRLKRRILDLGGSTQGVSKNRLMAR